ncbi:hypothetical protein F4778DRAFT_433555 [Xylariomycetidae sp. FL2044]|nr:hypothetical protein F4778DRAFT_433555 [Xylariomycetidae sp. FL2044]
MDPITALSVAAAAVGFFDCAYGLLKDYSDIRSTGETLTVVAFEQYANDLVAYNNALQTRPTFKVAPGDPLIEHEKALDRVLCECASIAQQLLEAIRSLKPKAQSAKWSSFLQALKTTWKAKDLQAMRDQLESCRKDLTIHVLGYLNAKTDVYAVQQGQQLSNLQEGNREIVDILTVIHADILERLAKQETDAQKRLEQHNTGQQQTAPGIIEAVFTFKDGNRQSLSPGVGPSPGPRDYKWGNIMTIQAETHDAAASSHFIQLGPAQRKVLDCLHFRYIHDRIGDIQLAHRTTFEWVYKQPGEGPPWSDLISWLETGNQCYWVSGKAASGKSTLMKFIYTDARFTSHLRRWAGDLPLVTASFFFWFLGTSLQKSQAGLLRALLFEILSKRPELIPIVAPELCREASKLKPTESLADPTLTEVTRWFGKLAEVTASTHRICIALDGLDEFDGDHGTLLHTLLQTVAKYPSIKLLISSRPITACTQAFSKCPQLRLQDLTEGDIRRYAEDLLKRQLQCVEDLEWTSVIEDIVDKSSGVFLWVSLVAKSLLVGLRDGDTGCELRARLEELPTDIRALYQHMMDRIPLMYRAQAAEIFQVLVINQQGPGANPFFEPLNPLQLSFALEKRDYAAGYDMETIPAKSVSTRASRIEARINSRCLGLVEVRKRWRAAEWLMGERYETVEFIHKTAFEFLNDAAVYRTLEDLTRPSLFDPFASLFGSCILLAKSDKKQTSIQRDSSGPTWGNLWSTLSVASLAEAKGRPLDPKYLFEYDRVLQRAWKGAEQWSWGSSRNLPALAIRGHWSDLLLIAEPSPVNGKANAPATIKMTPFPARRAITRQTDINSEMPYALLAEAVIRRWDTRSGIRGILFVAVIFTLPSFVNFCFNPISKPNLDLPTTSKPDINDATVLLEFLVSKMMLTNLKPNELICTDSDAKMAACLLQSGANPNLVLGNAVLQIGSVSKNLQHFIARGFSVWVLLLFLLDLEIQVSFSEESIDPAALEALLRSFVTHGADVCTPVEFSTGSFTPPEMLAVTIEALHTRWPNARGSTQLSASLERIRSMMLQRDAQPEKERQRRDSPPRYAETSAPDTSGRDEAKLPSRASSSKRESLMGRTRALFRRYHGSSVSQREKREVPLSR